MALLINGKKVEANETIKQQIRVSAKKYGIDPQLALAIAAVESSFNPNARGKLGEIGLFQTMPGTCKQPGTDCALRLLKTYKTACKDLGDAWFICYNNGPHRRPKHPKLFPYYKKVKLAMRNV